MGVESGETGDRVPTVNIEQVRRRHHGFENEVAQIRCLFRFLGYFGGGLATLLTIRPLH